MRSGPPGPFPAALLNTNASLQTPRPFTLGYLGRGLWITGPDRWPNACMFLFSINDTLQNPLLCCEQLPRQSSPQLEASSPVFAKASLPNALRLHTILASPTCVTQNAHAPQTGNYSACIQIALSAGAEQGRLLGRPADVWIQNYSSEVLTTIQMGGMLEHTFTWGSSN